MSGIYMRYSTILNTQNVLHAIDKTNMKHDLMEFNTLKQNTKFAYGVGDLNRKTSPEVNKARHGLSPPPDRFK